jgi:hypothetical protein
MGYWLGCILSVTALAVHLLILGAHRVARPRLSTVGIVGLLGLLLVATIGWGIAWRRAVASR